MKGWSSGFLWEDLSNAIGDAKALRDILGNNFGFEAELVEKPGKTKMMAVLEAGTETVASAAFNGAAIRTRFLEIARSLVCNGS